MPVLLLCSAINSSSNCSTLCFQVNNVKYNLSSSVNLIGRNIDDASAECLSHQCKNHGVCDPTISHSGVLNYSCICPIGFIGELCDKGKNIFVI